MNIKSRLSVLVQGELGIAFIRTFIARGIAAVGSFALIVAIGRFYGATGVGVFALAQSLLIAAATLARYGMDNAVMRFVGRDPQSSHVIIYVRKAFFRTFLLSVLASAVMILTGSLWAEWFRVPSLASILPIFAVAVPPFTLAFILAGFMKAVRKPATACLLQNGAVALVAALLLPVCNYFWPDNGIVRIGVIFAAAAWLILGQGLWHCRQWFKYCYNPAGSELLDPDIPAFNRSASAFFVSGLSKFIMKVLAIWIAGYFLITSDVGLFKAAQQIAMLVGVILIVINAIFPARFAMLFHQGRTKDLALLAKHGVTLGLVLAAVPTLICLIAPGLVLGMLGEEFSGAVNALRILAFAQLINITCGSVGFLLNMAGYEVLVRNINIICSITGIFTMIFLIPYWGIIAVAVGIALNLVLKNMANLYYVWKEMGIWTLPTPNVLKIMGVPSKPGLSQL